MSDTSFVYQSLVSARSRRLRTTSLFLLVVVIIMALYGYFSLMPSLRISAARQNAPNTISHSPGAASGIKAAAKQEASANAVERMSQRERDAQAAKIIFAYAYWGVCLSLLIALMLVAWLDFREVGRNFDQQQAAIFAASLKNETGQTE